MTRSQLVFRLSFLAIVALLMAAIWLLLRQLGMPASFAPSVLSDWFANQGTLGPVLLMLLM
ncbi:TVP38/TMEM64 family protein, partial [Rhizobium leguminosarum]